MTSGGELSRNLRRGLQLACKPVLAGEEGEPRRRNRGSQRNQANTSMAFAAAVKPLKRRWKRGKGRGLMGGGGWGRRVEEEGRTRRMGKGLAGETPEGDRG